MHIKSRFHLNVFDCKIQENNSLRGGWRPEKKNVKVRRGTKQGNEGHVRFIRVESRGYSLARRTRISEKLLYKIKTEQKIFSLNKFGR